MSGTLRETRTVLMRPRVTAGNCHPNGREHVAFLRITSNFPPNYSPIKYTLDKMMISV